MTKPQHGTSRWLGRIMAALFLVLTVFFGQTVFASGPLQAPQAEAQGTNGCHYRQGGTLDSSLCWIELGGISASQASSSSGQRMTIRLNETYSMSFTVKYNRGTSGTLRTINTSPVPTWGSAVFGNTIGGTTYYRAPAGVPTSTPMSFYTTVGAGITNPSVELRDITVTGASGAPTPDYGLVMADAESTNEREWLTFLSNTGVSRLDSFAPPGYTAACSGGLGARTGTGGASGTIPLNGLRCDGSAGTVGMLLTSTLNPSTVKIELGGPNAQGISLAVLMGGATGTVSADRRAEQGITPKTQFNLEALYNNRVLGTATTTDTSPGDVTGNFLLRTTTGSVTFRSTPTTNTATAWQRYRPEWTCTTMGPSGQSTPVTPTITRTGDTSQAVVTTSAGHTVDCDVRWTNLFDLTATLDLGKLVTGAAGNYDLLDGETFTLDYRCTREGFATAYPTSQVLTGEVTLARDGRQTISGLPVGANCTIRETRAFTDPSVTLTTGWTNTTTAPGSVPAAATRTLTLTTGRNIVSAVNQYAPVMGNLTVTKELEGSARSRFREDTFTLEYRCQDDPAGRWTPVGLAAVGDDDTDTVTLNRAIPVNRACEIRETDPPTQDNIELSTTIEVGADTTDVADAESVDFTVPAPDTAGGDASLTITVINAYDWTAVDVELATATLGTGRDVYTGGFDYTVVCTLDGEEVVNEPLAVAGSAVGNGHELADGQIRPTSAGTGNPVPFEATPGALCEVTLTGPATEARPELAVTGEDVRNREPYTYFLDYTDQVRVSAEGTEEDGSTSMTTDDVEVTDDNRIQVIGEAHDAWKDHSFRFVVPVPEDSDELPVHRIAATHVFELDARDVTVTKQVAPEGYDAGDFTFAYVCGPAEDPTSSDTVSIGDGESFTIDQVPVTTECAVTEDLGDSPAGPVTTWTPDNAQTSRLGELEAQTSPSADDRTSTATFTVLPVANATDLEPADGDWSVTVTNTYADLTITKTIAGGLVSEGGTAPFDTAVISPDSDTMTVTYEVTNTGGLDFEDIAVFDSSLADYTLRTLDGGVVTVGPDGRLNGVTCLAEGTLTPGASVSCEVVVSLPGDGTITYRDSATAIGVTPVVDSRELRAEDSDAFGAIRLSAAAFQLPDTGSKTLVGVLGLGLLVSLVALIGYLRNRGADE